MRRYGLFGTSAFVFHAEITGMNIYHILTALNQNKDITSIKLTISSYNLFHLQDILFHNPQINHVELTLRKSKSLNKTVEHHYEIDTTKPLNKNANTYVKAIYQTMSLAQQATIDEASQHKIINLDDYDSSNYDYIFQHLTNLLRQFNTIQNLAIYGEATNNPSQLESFCSYILSVLPKQFSLTSITFGRIIIRGSSTRNQDNLGNIDTIQLLKKIKIMLERNFLITNIFNRVKNYNQAIINAKEIPEGKAVETFKGTLELLNNHPFITRLTVNNCSGAVDIPKLLQNNNTLTEIVVNGTTISHDMISNNNNSFPIFAFECLIAIRKKLHENYLRLQPLPNSPEGSINENYPFMEEPHRRDFTESDPVSVSSLSQA